MAFGDRFRQAWDNATTAVRETAANVAAGTERAAEFVATQAGKVGQAVKSAAGKTWDAAKSAGKAVAKNFGTIARSAYAIGCRAVNAAITHAKDCFGQAISG